MLVNLHESILKGATQQGRQFQIRDQSERTRQQIAGDILLLCAVRQGDMINLILAVGPHRPPTASVGHAQKVQTDAHALKPLAGMRGDGPAESGQTQPRGLLCNEADVSATRPQLGRHRQEQRPAAGNDDALAGNRPAVLDQRLQAAGADNMRQGPARKWHEQLSRARSQDELLPSQLQTTPGRLGQQRVKGRGGNNRCFRVEGHAALLQTPEPAVGRRRCGMGLLSPPDLSAQPRSLFHQGDAMPAFGCLTGGRNAGGAGADHHDIAGALRVSHRSRPPCLPRTGSGNSGDAPRH